MTLNHLLQQIAPSVQTASTVAVAAVAAQSVAVLRKVGRKQALDTLRHLADTYVRAVEQQQAKTITNPAKKAIVFQRLKRALPWMPDALIDAAIEAAVSSLPKATGAPVSGPSDTGGTSVPPRLGG